MKHFLSTDRLYVAQSSISGAGRGVFAKVALKKGETIEICPVIELPQHDAASESFLVTYFYFFGKDKEQMVFALGFGSIYNHTDKPNAYYQEQLKEQAIAFVALRDIAKDEEILVNYLGSNEYEHPLWIASE